MAEFRRFSELARSLQTPWHRTGRSRPRFRREITMHKLSAIGSKLAAAIGAMAITMTMLSLYFAPVMASPFPKLLA
jgi:hypothetical protein